MWHFVIGLTNFLPPTDAPSRLVHVHNFECGKWAESRLARCFLYAILLVSGSKPFPLNPNNYFIFFYYFFLNAQLGAMALLEVPTYIPDMFYIAQETCFDIHNALTYVYQNPHVISIGNFQSSKSSSQQLHVNLDVGSYFNFT